MPPHQLRQLIYSVSAANFFYGPAEFECLRVGMSHFDNVIFVEPAAERQQKGGTLAMTAPSLMMSALSLISLAQNLMSLALSLMSLAQNLMNLALNLMSSDFESDDVIT